MTHGTDTPAPLHRRSFMGRVALGSALLGLSPRLANASDGEISINAMHNHVVSPDDVSPNGVRDGWMNWSAEQGRDATARAFISYAVPGIDNVARGRALTHLCNAHAVSIARARAGQFVVLASLPDLGDHAGVFQEIARTQDQDVVGGVTVMTSYGDRWLTDPSFVPVWNELNRRGALVFVQPSIPAAFGSDTPVVAESRAARQIDAAGAVAALQGRWSNIRFSNTVANAGANAGSVSAIPVHTYWWGMLPQHAVAEAVTLQTHSNLVA